MARGYYIYVSDNKVQYAVKLDSSTAGQGGFTSTTASKILDGTFGVWCWGWRGMRHVTGVDGSGKTRTLPIAGNGNDKYVNGGSFTLKGTQYNIRGCEGENRRGNRLVV